MPSGAAHRLIGLWPTDLPVVYRSRITLSGIPARTGPHVELLAVAELLTQWAADAEPVLRVDAELASVEQGVNVRSKQKPVVDAVFAAHSPLLGNGRMCAAAERGGSCLP